MKRNSLLIGLCGLAACAAQAVVVPPPLPPGSSMVRVQGGLSEPEQQRAVRAHQHKTHAGKSPSFDDGGHGHAAPAAPVPGAVRQFGNGPGDSNAVTAILNPAPWGGTQPSTRADRRRSGKTGATKTAPGRLK